MFHNGVMMMDETDRKKQNEMRLNAVIQQGVYCTEVFTLDISLDVFGICCGILFYTRLVLCFFLGY